ncbi:putative C2 domain, Rab-GTPase-TBC domain, Rab-GTPase-TBC domain superfamily [Plasmopara halstedii]
MNRKRLCVEVVGARNLESPQSVDAYCVVGLCDIKSNARGRSYLAGSPKFRSSTVTSCKCPTWGHAIELVVPVNPGRLRLRVQLYSAKNFFFDMFPFGSNTLFHEGEENASCSIGTEHKQTAFTSHTIVNGVIGVHDSDSDDVVTLSEEEDEVDQIIGDDDVFMSLVGEETVMNAAKHTDDEMLGILEINLTSLCKPTKVVTDSWYSLGGTRTGEVRIRTIWVEKTEKPLTAQDRAMLFEAHASRLMSKSMSDFYGFTIPLAARKDWVHLRSYQDCREERRVEVWTKLFSTQLPERLRRCSYKAKDSEEKALLMQLTRAGIPRHMRESAYLNLSGASEKQAIAGHNYYADLVEKAEKMDLETFCQIELDINRTFGNSGTTISSESGRSRLRRILQAYSLRNPRVGYCQGLNFIVAFLLLMADEENVFWLLSVFCEDLYPDFYCQTMCGVQRDMLVMKKLVAEELPLLDNFALDMGLPLELLGSQWLLCLFTTTFPSETVFRIFDCIFTEGSYFAFPVIMAHLRHLEPTLLGLHEFQDVLSSIKNAECTCIDGDLFMELVCKEMKGVTMARVQRLREQQCGSVRSVTERNERTRDFNNQLAAICEVPAFSKYAAGLLRAIHEEAEESSRSDVAFVLTILCHGLVWLAERSKQWSR